MESHKISFKMALSGIGYAFRSQPNFLIHISAAVLVVMVGVFFRLSLAEWVAVIISIVLVILAEMINTAIESTTDLITEEYNKKAKIAKDVSAGMVLVAAIGASLIGLFVFVPKLVRLCSW